MGGGLDDRRDHLTDMMCADNTGIWLIRRNWKLMKNYSVMPFGPI